MPPPESKKDNTLYILMISIHGLIRAQELELGVNSDTGGQTKYVIELSKTLAEHPNVGRVDLLTRLIDDQHGMYRNHDANRYRVIPPGIDTSRFSPPLKAPINESLKTLIDKFLFKKIQTNYFDHLSARSAKKPSRSYQSLR